MSRARILIRTPEEKFDPYPAQTLFEKIRRRRALEPVIAKLNLTSALAKEAGVKGELTPEEAYENLLRRIQLRQSRYTPLVEITVYSESADLSARIANEITEAAMQQEGVNVNRAGNGEPNFKEPESNSAIPRISWVEKAVPGSRPVRPNVPLNIVAGGILSVVVAVAAAALMRLILKAVSPA